jgi:hypothetical protein
MTFSHREKETGQAGMAMLAAGRAGAQRHRSWVDRELARHRSWVDRELARIVPGCRLVRQAIAGHHRLMDHSVSGTPPPAIRALIADDHLVVRRGIGALLASITGIEVVAEASTGQDVLREARLAPHSSGADAIDVVRQTQSGRAAS